MDIQDLNKKQLILLTLLITFIVSIATGIVTVSLMNKMPAKTVQTINNVVQRTVEKVILPAEDKKEIEQQNKIVDTNEALVNIYLMVKNDSSSTTTEPAKSLGQGLIISDAGLILTESSILNEENKYVVMLGKDFFSTKIIKKFGNGFTVLGIISKTDPIIIEEKKEDNSINTNPETSVDNTQQ